MNVPEAAAMYRSHIAGRQMLVVLDNARAAEDVRVLLPGTPSCVVVVTSRDRLKGLVARDGAVRVPLEVLSPGEAADLVETLLGGLSHDSTSFAAIAEACAYLPLALRIAIAHLLDQPHQTAGDLVRRLRTGRRLETLAVMGDDAAAVRSTFALSYQSVSPESQLLFRRLGLVPLHDFTPESAAALANVSEGEAVQLLERLADAHLISPIAKDRYGIHDLLREYAGELCESVTSDAREAAENRLYHTYLSRAEAAGDLIYPTTIRLASDVARGKSPFESEAQALTWLDNEEENIIAIIRHAAGAAAGITWMLADAVRGHFDMRRRFASWLAAGRAGLTAARARNNLQAQAAMFHMIGHAYAALGRYEPARKHFGRAQALSQRCGWARGEYAALANRGNVIAMLGNPTEAMPLLLQAFEKSVGFGNPLDRSMRLTNIATVHWLIGDLDLAAHYCQEGMSLMAAAGKPYNPAISILGRIQCLLGRHDVGLPNIDSGLAALRSVRHLPFEAYAQIYRSEALLELGQLREASKSAERAIQVARKIDLHLSLADGLVALGRCLHEMGEGESSVYQILREAIDVATAATPFELANAYIGLSRVQEANGDFKAALASAEHGLDLCIKHGYRLRQGQAVVVMAGVHLALGNKLHAQGLATEALEIQQKTGHLLGQAEALALLAQCEADSTIAAEHAEAARLIYQRTGAVPLRGLAPSVNQ